MGGTIHMQAVVGASAAPLGVPGVPVAPQCPVGQRLQGPAITAEALEYLGWRILAQESQGVHLEGGDIEGPVDEDPGDSLGAGRGAERALIGDKAEGLWEQELQAQVLKKVGVILVGDAGDGVAVKETTEEWVRTTSHVDKEAENGQAIGASGGSAEIPVEFLVEVNELHLSREALVVDLMFGPGSVASSKQQPQFTESVAIKEGTPRHIDHRSGCRQEGDMSAGVVQGSPELLSSSAEP